MKNVNFIRLSKLLSHMLRHHPAEYGLTLDAEGFADLNSVWMQIKRQNATLNPKDWLLWLESAAAQQRFEMRDGKIRARYGHSAPQITYEPAVPPETLYHGTATTALESILQIGLTAQRRQYVHLAVERDRAENVAGRHQGAVVLLLIQAFAAYQAGIVFYHPEPRHYLVKALPPEYIKAESRP